MEEKSTLRRKENNYGILNDYGQNSRIAIIIKPSGDVDFAGSSIIYNHDKEASTNCAVNHAIALANYFKEHQVRPNMNHKERRKYFLPDVLTYREAEAVFKQNRMNGASDFNNSHYAAYLEYILNKNGYIYIRDCSAYFPDYKMAIMSIPRSDSITWAQKEKIRLINAITHTRDINLAICSYPSMIDSLNINATEYSIDEIVKDDRECINIKK